MQPGITILLLAMGRTTSAAKRECRFDQIFKGETTFVEVRDDDTGSAVRNGSVGWVG
jgi:hypothetical protein